MPRSFMIIHRRFNDETHLRDIIPYSKKVYQDNFSRVTCENRTPALPEMKDPHRGRDKPVSTSDGESDSGCSTITDAGHELLPELEYSDDCSYGFSHLSCPLARIPQRYSEKDVLDNDSDYIIPWKVLQKCNTEVRVEDLRRFNIRSNTSKCADRAKHVNTHPRLASENAACLDYLKKSMLIGNEYIQEAVLSTNDNNILFGRDLNGDQVPCKADMKICSRSVPASNVSVENCNNLERQHVERAILVGKEWEDLHNVECVMIPETSNDEPIDYSQLSSRWKENKDGGEYVQVTKKTEGSREFDNIHKMSDFWARGPPEEIFNCGKKIITNHNFLPKVQFILWPKMDANGNLVLPQSERLVKNSTYPEVEQTFGTNNSTYPGVEQTFVTNSSTCPGVEQTFVTKTEITLCTPPTTSPNYFVSSATQSETGPTTPSSISSTSSGECNPESKNKIVLDEISGKFEHTNCDNKKTGVTKKQMSYHPKLKHLLAACHVVGTEVKQEDEHVLSCTANKMGSLPSFRQNKRSLYPTDCTQNKRSLYPTDCTQNKRSLYPTYYTQNKLSLYPTDYTKNKRSLYPTDYTQNKRSLYLTDCTQSIMKLDNHKEYMTLRVDQDQTQCVPEKDISNTTNGAGVSKLNFSSPLKVETTIDTAKSRETRHLTLDSERISSTQWKEVSKSCSENVKLDHLQSRHKYDLSFTGIPASSDQFLSSDISPEQQSESILSINHKSGVEPYACSDCGKRYSTSSNLSRHRQTHRNVCDKKARKCQHCDKVYVSLPAYNMHVQTHNSGCVCSYCGKRFSRHWLLQGHIRTHTGEKPFPCPKCGKSFADKSNLRAHIQTHSTEKPYACGRCRKAFSLKSYLYKHEEGSCMRSQRLRRLL